MGNLFEQIPEDTGEEMFSSLLQSENVRIERIVSTGQSSPESGWYDQEENEWVVVLKGEAKISLKNGGDVHLAPGGYINIPAHQKHRVVWTTADTQTIWLAIHYK